MPDSVPDMLLPDKPLKELKDDLLGYASFAERIAESVSERIPVDGLVTAIHGPWGSGKSTVLNFVEHCLEALPDAERPIIVRFNPWWFSGRQDIVLQFFGQLRQALSRLRVKAEDVVRLIADLTGALSSFAGPYGPYGAAAAQATKALLPDQTDPHKLKVKIEKALNGSDQRVVFIIDDIDRLAKDEIRELFTAIRAIADFPKVCYLLAFDWEVVVKALDSAQGIRGEDYLQKIVQVPVPLPLPLRKALELMLVKSLNALFRDTPPELNDKLRWDRFFTDGIRHFIETPRQVLRLVNSVAMFYRYVQNELKCADYVALKTLGAFCPLVYRVIESNRGMFVELTGEDIRDPSKKEAVESFHKSWLKEVAGKERKRVVSLLMVMFPVLESILKGIDLEGLDRGKD